MERHYEVIFAVRPGTEEKVIKGITQKVTEIIASRGKVIKVEDWGKRKVAYPVRKESEAHYLLVNLSGPPSLPKEIERVLRLNEDVVRCQTCKIVPRKEATAVVSSQ
ncbi:MAG: 30S ribosomal protein S6 [Deltaproteobacteria bacterium]|nr:30S ribosomal protein S6 [Deltaproteobacteria bacterium]